MDEVGLIRVGGRLEKSALTAGQKHPVILHHSDCIPKLICTQLHVDYLHIGPTALLALMSLRFNIVGFKHLTKGVSRAYVHCRKVYAKTTTQPMGQLPASLVTPSSPFHHTKLTSPALSWLSEGILMPGHCRRLTYVFLFAWPPRLCTSKSYPLRVFSPRSVASWLTEDVPRRWPVTMAQTL